MASKSQALASIGLGGLASAALTLILSRKIFKKLNINIYTALRVRMGKLCNVELVPVTATNLCVAISNHSQQKKHFQGRKGYQEDSPPFSSYQSSELSTQDVVEACPGQEGATGIPACSSNTEKDGKDENCVWSPI